MTFKQALDNITGLRFIYDSMELMSAPGRRMMLSSPFMTSSYDIDQCLESLKKVTTWIHKPSNNIFFDDFKHILMLINDIGTSIDTLGGGRTAGDIDFFEIKHLSLLAVKARRIIEMSDFPCINIPDLTEVIEILDPEKTEATHFFIYNSYDKRLSPLRKKLNNLNPDSSEAANVFSEISSIEEEVRVNLTAKLAPFSKILFETLNAFAYADILMAKASLADALSLSRPIIQETGDTIFRKLFNPEIDKILANDGKKFQPVDIKIKRGVTLITGANMGGKTVLLKTVALSQIMTQFGFYVPAENATVVPVDEIILLTGDSQSELSGLSSFAAEMLRIDDAIRKIRNIDSNVLLLIDEPARTTNPDEGKAMSGALLSILSESHSRSLVTSHYSGLHAPRAYRVKGLMEKEIPSGCSLQELSRLMDYSLMEDDGEKVPHEALHIAAILGIDSLLLKKASSLLEEEKHSHKS